MEVGVQVIFSGGFGVPDRQVYQDELELSVLAEDLGFDALWVPEHHFYDYSIIPDNVEVLAYLAGRTSRIALGTAAVIMPWNDPLRVAEKIAILDHVSNGRVRFGMGRGLSRREYAHFAGIDMAESRARFDEAAAMVVSALETGFIEGDGPFYPQPRTAIRPAPFRTFKGRTYAVATSEDSIEAAARLGATMVMFAERSWGHRLESIELWRTRYRELQGAEPGPMMIGEFTYCHRDSGVAAERGRQYLLGYLQTLLEHYEMGGTHFDDIEAYRDHAAIAAMMRQAGEERFLESFLDATVFGTPEQILEKYRKRRDKIGAFESVPSFRFGGIPRDLAEESMRLFAAEVLPELHSWSA